MSRCYVKKGQVYKVKRLGKPALYIRIMGIRETKGHQPKASYRRITRTTGKIVGSKAALPCVHWLTWDIALKCWIMGPNFEEIK